MKNHENFHEIQFVGTTSWPSSFYIYSCHVLARCSAALARRGRFLAVAPAAPVELDGSPAPAVGGPAAAAEAQRQRRRGAALGGVGGAAGGDAAWLVGLGDGDE